MVNRPRNLQHDLYNFIAAIFGVSGYVSEVVIYLVYVDA